ncbi:MAG: AAA family ATPase [Candidatus Omnitrophica bacterium CG23_combo_of_CG06-09_8_20_14_all_41_10]|uniref:AAA family ATPase n=1 Tax=Candidatus Sherwoodlollariibacterium unditelluris TaxID=1974757 RepID=A0A2G9YK70_9BACT|nr:MAG: AAA family ATPase [Candidatus Omnitrophica bacterium CG23_combo_of_CG06-09_8_20_14_all_41_10]
MPPKELRIQKNKRNRFLNEANVLPDKPVRQWFGSYSQSHNLELTDEFVGTFNLIENTNDNIFITGKAGTGKSTLLKYFKENTAKNAAVLAPTGVAAINVGGQTIHSFFRFPPRLIRKGNIRRRRNSEIIQKLDTVIVDEVSMVRADLMDGIDYALRINRDEMKLPFGGVQMVFFGDLFQLPPVVEKEAQSILGRFYDSPYFFKAKVFNKLKLRYVELNKNYRQSDTQFIDLLNKIRNKTQVDDDLDLLNQRVRKINPGDSNQCVILTATNNRANTINEEKLAELSDKEYKYEAAITGNFKESAYPTEYCLRLKKGAQIILIRNDLDKRWVNGTIANIAALSPGTIKVSINGGIYEVSKSKWEKIEYKYNRAEDKIEEKTVGTFEQYPIKLAWAITIHKSQGQTFDNIVVDLGAGAFTHGQVYVGLSRCTTLGGIILKRPVIASDIIFDERVYEFRNRFLNLI